MSSCLRDKSSRSILHHFDLGGIILSFSPCTTPSLDYLFSLLMAESVISLPLWWLESGWLSVSVSAESNIGIFPYYIPHPGLGYQAVDPPLLCHSHIHCQATHQLYKLIIIQPFIIQPTIPPYTTPPCVSMLWGALHNILLLLLLSRSVCESSIHRPQLLNNRAILTAFHHFIAVSQDRTEQFRAGNVIQKGLTQQYI